MMNMKIKWNNYVDQIYSLSYPGNQEQMEKHRNEICRVDILDSGIYYNYINIRTPFYKYIFDNINKFYNYICYNNGFFITMGHYHILKQAYEMGYDYIAIMEYDISFLKDKQQIIKILDSINDAKKLDFDVCCCQLEYTQIENMFDFNNQNFFSYKPKIEEHVINDQGNLGGAGFNVYSRKGLEKVINILENDYCTIDNYWQMTEYNNLKVVSIHPWICIQDKYNYYITKEDIKQLYNLSPFTDEELTNELIKMLSPVGINSKGILIQYIPCGGYNNLTKNIMNKMNDKTSDAYKVMEALYYFYSEEKDKALKIFNSINLKKDLEKLYNFAKNIIF